MRTMARRALAVLGVASGGDSRGLLCVTARAAGGDRAGTVWSVAGLATTTMGAFAREHGCAFLAVARGAGLGGGLVLVRVVAGHAVEGDVLALEEFLVLLVMLDEAAGRVHAFLGAAIVALTA